MADKCVHTCCGCNKGSDWADWICNVLIVVFLIWLIFGPTIVTIKVTTTTPATTPATTTTETTARVP